MWWCPSENSGGRRLEITPKTAQVFVDGNDPGVVHDFNGHFQHCPTICRALGCLIRASTATHRQQG